MTIPNQAVLMPLSFEILGMPLYKNQQPHKPLFHSSEARKFPSPRIDLQTSHPGQKAAGLPNRTRLAVSCLLISRCEFDPQYYPHTKFCDTETHPDYLLYTQVVHFQGFGGSKLR